MKRWLLAYALTAVIFAAIDVAWIITVAQRQYQSQIGHLLAASPNPLGAVVFYLIFVAGIVHYGVRPGQLRASMRQRIVAGAFFGFFAYSTWALTALAVLKDFPVMIAVTDIAWGAGVCALVTWLAVAALRKIRLGGTAA
ncbi:hypothetical protein CQ020_02135 [Arthrobacter sp. MYb23]|uniref:DUF2177 family protein n=1 Tax=unclassified Arthrobacter TaxID=235627 RepID=UPI000CFD4632|nr:MULTISPECIES: DUF2177 family protein [unclassified Arthrobacter]PRB44936.1 hypothetical protein CQ038_00645 [Arthrobacter sp. MYb51]PRB99601.1 hypothetical protein CQ020_02135 [Arthrobacter sp. MYb23]